MSVFMFNFKKQFALAVESGEKHQTVRANRKDGRLPKIGDTAKCFTGLRTTSTRLLMVAPIVDVQRVLIDFNEGTIALNDGRMTIVAADTFAKADGFATFREMLQWFRDAHKMQALFHPHIFEGFYTQWTPPQNNDVKLGGEQS